MIKKRIFDVFCAAAELMVEECNGLYLSSEELNNLEVKFVRFEKSAWLEGRPGECFYQSSRILMLADVLGVPYYISAQDSNPKINFFSV